MGSLGLGLYEPWLLWSCLSSGGLAMLLAMRRASSSVSTFAMWASFGFSREYTYASDWPLASQTLSPPGIFSTVQGGGNLLSVIRLNKKRGAWPLGPCSPRTPVFPSRLRAVSLVSRFSDHGECRALANPPIKNLTRVARKSHAVASPKKSTQPVRLGAQKRFKARAPGGKPTHNGQRH